MRARGLLLIGLLSGCDVPFEVDPMFGIDGSVDSGHADTATDTSVENDAGGESDTGSDASIGEVAETSLVDSAGVDGADGAVVDTTPEAPCSEDLATDVNNCGACGRICATANGTPSCVASACAIAACNVGYSSCDSDPNACELEHGASSNTCATAQVLAVKGDPNVCGSATTTTTAPATTTTTRFYRLKLVRCPPCTPSQPVRARITLVNPAGVAHDLFVWRGTTCSDAPTKSSTSGVLGGTETVTLDDLGCDASTEVSIEMRYRAGGSCSGATLTATGAY